MTPRERAELVFSEHEFAWREGDREHQIKIVQAAIEGALKAAAACQPISAGRGGWSDWQQPIMKGYRMQCCDCGLVHEMEFRALEQLEPAGDDDTWAARPVKNGRVEFRARRES